MIETMTNPERRPTFEVSTEKEGSLWDPRPRAG